MTRSGAVVALGLAGVLLAGCASVSPPSGPPTGEPTTEPTSGPTIPATPDPTPTSDPAGCETVLTAAEHASLEDDGFSLMEFNPLGPVMEAMVADGGLGCFWGRSSGDVRVWFAQQEMDDAAWQAMRGDLVAQGFAESDDPFEGTLQAPATFGPTYIPAVYYGDGIMYFASYSDFLMSVLALKDVPRAAGGPCADGQLEVSLEARPHASGAGHFYWDIVFTNVSGTGCVLTGPPEFVALVNPGGEHSYSEVSPFAEPGKPVNIAPGGQAYSLLSLSQAGAYSSCEMFAGDELVITPPGSTEPVLVPTPYETDGCAGTDVMIMDHAPVEPEPHLVWRG